MKLATTNRNIIVDTIGDNISSVYDRFNQ